MKINRMLENLCFDLHPSIMSCYGDLYNFLMVKFDMLLHAYSMYCVLVNVKCIGDISTVVIVYLQ